MLTNISIIHLLHGQNEAVLTFMARNAVVRQFAAGQAISWQTDPCESVYFILKGDVEIYRLSPAGREQILDRHGQGGCFNLIPAIMEDAPNQANARALKGCELLILRKSDFRKLLAEFPEFTLAVARFCAERLMIMTDLIETLSLYSVRQRAAKFLISQADKADGSNTFHWTQTDMAKHLGTVRDVLGRTLRKFADEGLVRFEREKIILIDRKGLEKASIGDE